MVKYLKFKPYWNAMDSIKDRIKYLRGELSQEDFAKKLGVSYGSIQNWENNNKIPKGDYLVLFHEKLNVDTNWLLTGKGSPFLSDALVDYIKEPSPLYEVPKTSNVVELQHFDVVKRFKNKERAKTINETLVEIENISPDAFKGVEEYLKGMAIGLKYATPTQDTAHDRRQHDRRHKDSEDSPPAHEERRTVKNRRAANGN